MARKQAPYNVEAPKQTVSLAINSDLCAQAEGLGLDASQIAEEAIAVELARRHAARVQAEIRADLEASNTYQAKHGSFAAMVRAHYRRDDA